MQQYGMTRTFPINYDKSVEVFEQYADILKRKECYENVWKLFDKTCMFSEWETRICFGYVVVQDCGYQICVEHCFLMTQDNEIVDITCQREYSKYYVLMALTPSEYLDLILQSKITDLSNLELLKELKNNFEDQAKGKECICIG